MIMTSFLREVCSVATVCFCRRSLFLFERERESERERRRRGLGSLCVAVQGEERRLCVCDRRRRRGLDLWIQSCVYVCVGVSHLALPPIPPPSPPRPPGHRFSAAGSAGDTHRTPDPPSARSSWPETGKEDTETKECVCVERRVGEAAAGAQ